jgi:hypothetical protein
VYRPSKRLVIDRVSYNYTSLDFHGLESQ